MDGLRGVAIAMVAIHHAFPKALPGGFIGVDVFFVISGWLITGILLGEGDVGRRIDVAGFYARRVRRLFPALTVVLAATLSAGWALLFADELAALGRHVAASAGFLENVALWKEASYFDRSAWVKPTRQLWSLAVEEQFYIVWPLAIAGLRGRRRWSAAACVALMLASFALNLRDAGVAPAMAYYSPLGRGWELMAGALLAHRRGDGPTGRWADALSLAGLILLGAGLAAISADRAFPGWWALLPVSGTAALLAVGAGASANRLLARWSLVRLGLISYPFYLWHWPVLAFARILVGPLPMAVAAGGLLGSLALAAATWRWVERPLRHRPGATVAWLVAAMAAVGLAGALVWRGVVPARHDDGGVPRRNEWSFFAGKGWITGGGTAHVYRLAAERPRGVLVIGDSRMAQYAVRFDKLLQAHPQWPGVDMAVGGGCLPVDGLLRPVPVAGCAALLDRAMAMADESEYRIVVIGGAWQRAFREAHGATIGADRIALDSDEGMRRALAAVGARIARWRAAGKRVVVVLDNPISEGFDVADWRMRVQGGEQTRGAKRERLDAEQAGLQRAMRRWAASTGARVIDPMASLCPAGWCAKSEAGGLRVWRNDGHLNPDWTAARAGFIDAAITP